MSHANVDPRRWQSCEVIGATLMITGVAGLAMSIAFLAVRRGARRSAEVFEELRYAGPPA